MKDDEVLKKARERYDLEITTNAELRKKQIEDRKFKNGEQWPAKVKHDRENDPFGARPCLVINHARTHANNVINDLRQNRPQIKVLPVDSDADVETADMYNGLLRHIQVSGDADLAYDSAMTDMVDMGEGYFEIVTAVVDEASGEQELDIEPILNPHSVHMDPLHENPTGADAEWCFVDEPMTRDDFKETYPGVEISDWSDVSGDSKLTNFYLDEERVNLARYFYKEVVDGKTTWHVCKLVGDKILERSTLPGKYLTIIRVAGEETVIDGKRDVFGIIRPIMDPCRQYNYWASVNTERIALSPKAPYIGAAGAFENYEEEWDAANSANIPRLRYNAYDSEGNPLPPPARSAPVSQDTAIVQAMLQAHDDIKAVSGKFDPSLGNRSNETSGVAIQSRQRQGDIATFHFVDNLSRSIRQAGRVLVDLIPKIYNTEKIVRILGEDDTPDFAQLAPTGRAMTEVRDAGGGVQRIYDIGVGTYDVTVRAGPSFATRRQESIAEMSDLLGKQPQAFALIGHKLIANMDWPGAQECAEILEAALPPEIKSVIDANGKGGDKVAAAVEQANQQLLDQLEPVIEQLKQEAAQAVEAAQKVTQENQALQFEVRKSELTNMELKIALKDKSGELEAKMKEIDAHATAEQQKAESSVITAAISNRVAEDSDAAQAAMAAVERTNEALVAVEALGAALAQQSAVIGQIAEQTAQQLAQVGEGSERVNSEVARISDYLVASEAKKGAVTAAVLNFMRGNGDDASLADVEKVLQ